MLGGPSADRTSFLNALDVDLARDQASVAVVRVDLDRFSRIRQTFGPATARVVRSTLATRMDELAAGAGHVLRYGEDAFIAIVRVTDTTAEGLEAVAMGIVAAISAPILVDDQLEIAVGSNVGIAAAAHFDDSDPLRLLTGAELAIQRANAIGSRRGIVYEVVTRGDPTRLPQLFADMLSAIAAGQFQPVYQPLVSLPERTISGAEALVRWQHPLHGVLSPIEFIGEAERSGLIRDIDAQMREAACATFASMAAGGRLVVSVNLSAADLDAPDLAEQVQATLSGTGLRADRLVLEVTETALSQDWAGARRRLESLKELGVRLAVDDFGVGHMFLDRLSTGLFDILKIDRSLVIPEDDGSGRHAALLSAINSMAHTLGMDVVAEGVETDEQLDRVMAAGCTRAQGYLFAPPMSSEAFAALAASGAPL